MNNLQSIGHLKNNYYGMRHGQSKANVRGIIVSHPANGLLKDFALTDIGREQVRISAKESFLNDQTVIFSSDFSRAKETAEIVCQIIGAKEIQLTEALRERSFGKWEKTNHKHYQDVWDSDKADAEHTENGVEPVALVLDRSSKLIVDIESQYEGKNVLLVSHGDCLQILQTGFQKISATEHRSLTHFETAEIRLLTLVDS